MPKNWNLYLQRLREVDDNLYNQKEQFKVGLITSESKTKKEEKNVDGEEDLSKGESYHDDHEKVDGEKMEKSEKTDEELSEMSEV